MVQRGERQFNLVLGEQQIWGFVQCQKVWREGMKLVTLSPKLQQKKIHSVFNLLKRLSIKYCE